MTTHAADSQVDEMIRDATTGETLAVEIVGGDTSDLEKTRLVNRRSSASSITRFPRPFARTRAIFTSSPRTPRCEFDIASTACSLTP